ncbi:MAG: GAF domain-containing protein [Acaryochloridaceae cyanobacterium RU_4_10]|nr:GAF domain-containing protein [Acaryochloridaceae cyanobacterium RU_4_10]
MNQSSGPESNSTPPIAPLKPDAREISKVDRFLENRQKRNADPKPEKLAEIPAQALRQAESWGLSTKVTLAAIAFSAIPLLIVGFILYGWGQSFKPSSNKSVAATEVQQYSSNLGLGAAGLAIASGGIAALLVRRSLRPILKASNTSNTLVNRLRREDVAPRTRVEGKDELVALETNLQLVAEQFPQLLANQEAEAERARIVINITRRLRESLSEEEVLRVAAEEIRKVFRSDRVAFFRFDSAEDGTIVEESVAPGWPKMLWTTLADPCLADYLEQYRNGRVRVIDDIHNAGLNDCHIGLLERFAVKANLIAPIVKDDRLFGLMIANQCSGPRFWQQTDIDLFTQLSAQVGFALEHSRLLEQIDSKATQSHIFIELARRIRASLNEEDILKTTVEEIRKILATDRVVVYSFDPNWYGTVVAESVVPGFPKALWAKIKDPCFAEGYVEQYQGGRVQATPNIYEAGMTACHLKQLEPFAVKANLVAPILKDDHLFALLIAHECSRPRNWQQSEIDLFAQLATQVGFALDHARVLAQVDTRVEQSQVLIEISRHIREYLNEEDILKTTVEQVRKFIRADRVVVYNFQSDWGGWIAAESVLPGWPHALDFKIADACIPESLRAEYLTGRVVPTRNVSEAGFHSDHRALMERLKIQANLVAPILNNGHLFGLLIAHQCSGPRDWRPSEIDLFSQIATQVGFALEHTRVLDQVEQAYQVAESSSVGQRQQIAVLQQEVSKWLQTSQPSVQALSTEMMQQMESVTVAYQHLKTLATETQGILSALTQQNAQQQPTQAMLTQGTAAIGTLGQCIATLQTNGAIAAQQLHHLSDPVQKVAAVSGQLTQLASQMKLQAMNAALEATRRGDSAQEFASIGEKVLELARQLDTKTADLATISQTIQTQLLATSGTIQESAQQMQVGLQRVEQGEEIFARIVEANTQLQGWIESMLHSAQSQSNASTTANQMILEVASRANQATEQAIALSDTVAQLSALTHQEETT